MGASSIVRSLRAGIVFGLLVAGLIGAGAARASAATCQSWGGQPPDVGTGFNQLEGIAATSDCNALAVGYYSNGNVDQTLIEAWNGKAWKVQTSPDPGTSANENVLSDVAALSPKNAWAVGSYYNGTAYQTLIEHWNGKVWARQTSPNPGTSPNSDQLSGVAALSPTNVWAVGSYSDTAGGHTLIEHWNGKRWSQQLSPSRGQTCSVRSPLLTRPALSIRGGGLSSVTAVSPSNAWAVGVRCGHHASQTLIEHWNGQSWKVQRSPNPGGYRLSAGFSGVAATSSTNAWAVGGYVKSSTTPERTLVERWNGRAWKVQPSPNVNQSRNTNRLFDVAGTSSTNAWAVGTYGGMLADPPLIERWNGTSWKIQPSTSIPQGSLLSVAAISPQSAWAAGSYYDGTNYQNLILHCC